MTKIGSKTPSQSPKNLVMNETLAQFSCLIHQVKVFSKWWMKRQWFQLHKFGWCYYEHLISITQPIAKAQHRWLPLWQCSVIINTEEPTKLTPKPTQTITFSNNPAALDVKNICYKIVYVRIHCHLVSMEWNANVYNFTCNR